MKRWKKVVLVLLGLILLSQSPFIYRRFQLRSLSHAIRDLNAQRALDQNDNGYTDYKGVIHVHSMLGGHSTGNFTDIIRAANLNKLQFVVMTEHPQALLNTSEMTLKGVHGGVLFINGNEVSTATKDRLLLLPGDESASTADRQTTDETLAQVSAQNRLAFVAYPEEFHSWEASPFNGIEVYNLYTNARKINGFVMFFDGLWSYASYPELLFTRFYERPSENLKKWDELTTRGSRLVAIAGNDAHANVGVSLGDASGKRLLQIQLDPYERSFQLFRTHALIEKEKPLSTESLMEALASGHSYIAFDLFCDASGFRYTAENRSEKRLMGDEISVEDGVRLTVRSPVASRIVLFKDGQMIQEESGVLNKDFTVNQKGVYRVELYLPQLGALLQDKPWIISNPIYVR
jgi:hypothetical protein